MMLLLQATKNIYEFDEIICFVSLFDKDEDEKVDIDRNEIKQF